MITYELTKARSDAIAWLYADAFQRLVDVAGYKVALRGAESRQRVAEHLNDEQIARWIDTCKAVH